MPRKKIDHTEEQRITLGEYERKLAQDALTMNGLRSASIAASGVAQGLGIFGAIGIGALLWGKDIEDLFEQMVGIWPESGAFFSPEWIAKWGDDPIDQTSDAQNQTDNEGVNSLPPIVQYDSTGQVIVSRSLEGKSPYKVYTISAAGRAASYEHSKNNIISNYTLKHGVGIYPGSPEEDEIIAEWYKNNPQPPPFLLDNQVANQTNIRVTCARRNLSFMRYFQNVDPSKNTNFIDDPLLDWLAYNTVPMSKNGDPKEPHATVFNSTPKSPYNYIVKANRGEQLIAIYAFWSAPLP